MDDFGFVAKVILVGLVGAVLMAIAYFGQPFLGEGVVGCLGGAGVIATVFAGVVIFTMWLAG